MILPPKALKTKIRGLDGAFFVDLGRPVAQGMPTEAVHIPLLHDIPEMGLIKILQLRQIYEVHNKNGYLVYGCVKYHRVG